MIPSNAVADSRTVATISRWSASSRDRPSSAQHGGRVGLARGLGGLLRRADRILDPALLRQVGERGNEPAVGQAVGAGLDDRAVGPPALESPGRGPREVGKRLVDPVADSGLHAAFRLTPLSALDLTTKDFLEGRPIVEKVRLQAEHIGVMHVPGGDAPVAVEHHDRLVDVFQRRLDDLLLFGPRAFGSPAFGHVGDGRDIADPRHRVGPNLEDATVGQNLFGQERSCRRRHQSGPVGDAGLVSGTGFGEIAALAETAHDPGDVRPGFQEGLVESAQPRPGLVPGHDPQIGPVHHDSLIKVVERSREQAVLTRQRLVGRRFGRSGARIATERAGHVAEHGSDHTVLGISPCPPLGAIPMPPGKDLIFEKILTRRWLFG